MKSRSVGVHNGVFHADEVTACALLILFNLVDIDKIIRTRDQKKLDECEYVCDVGGCYSPEEKRFDHHQSSYAGSLSSAGMVMGYLRDFNIMPEDEYEFLYKNLVQGVDDHDNGRTPQIKGHALFSHVIANFNPIAYDTPPELIDVAFHEALNFTIGHLRRILERFRYNKECQKIVSDVMKRCHKVLIFDQAIPWVDSFFALGGNDHPAIFVVMPSGKQWKLRGIPPDEERRMEVRVPLPLQWAGLLEDDLQKVSGIKGAIFCHKGRFTSVWDSKEAALIALDHVMKLNGIEDEDHISKNNR